MASGRSAAHLIEVSLPRPPHPYKGFGTHKEHIGQAKQHDVIIHELAILGCVLIYLILPHACSGRLHIDRKSTRLNSSHANISYAVFCLKKKKKTTSHDYLSLIYRYKMT